MRLLSLTLYYFYEVIYWAILVYCIGSWFIKPGTKFTQLWIKLSYFVDPLFRPARWLMQKLNLFRLPIDFSPWLTMILLSFIYRLLQSLLVW